MLSLQKHHIINLFVWVDDLVPKKQNALGGRPNILSDSEVITILIWDALNCRSKTLKGIYEHTQMYHQDDFQRWPKYNSFVDECHRVFPLCIVLLEQILSQSSQLVFVDSTMLEVCKLVRADRHKVAKKVADFGKNHQGWHYGFKMHISANFQKQLCSIVFTSANQNDAQQLPKLLNGNVKIAVGDGGYSAGVMREYINKKYGTIIISPPHFKQKKKVITFWQDELLKLRPKIETIFDFLKEHMNIVTSFARSIKGYFIHYVRILLSYQILALS